VPEGFVNVTSTFADGSTGNTTVAFGNQNWVPERDASDVIQIVDNLRYKAGNLNFVFGTDNNINHVTDRLSHDQQVGIDEDRLVGGKDVRRVRARSGCDP